MTSYLHRDRVTASTGELLERTVWSERLTTYYQADAPYRLHNPDGAAYDWRSRSGRYFAHPWYLNGERVHESALSGGA